MATVALVDGAGYFVTFGDGAWHEVQDAGLLAGYGLSTDGAAEYPTTDYVQPVVDVLGPAAGGGGEGGGGGGSSPPTALPAFYPPTGAVYTFDAANGFWRHVPDVPTANAMRIDWGNMTDVSAPPQPAGPDWLSVTQAAAVSPTPPPAAPQPPAGTVAGTNQPAVSFAWGGLTWAAGDLSRFIGYLAAHGADYATWAASHPDAAAILEGPPVDPAQERVPKSVGQALGSAIAAGATPAQAAAQAAGLAAAQAAQGFGAPQGAALEQAAQDVYNAYVASGGVPAPAGAGGGGGGGGGGASDTSGPERSLQGVVPSNLFDSSQVPAGVTTSWKALVGFWAHTVPKSPADVTSVVNQTKALLT